MNLAQLSNNYQYLYSPKSWLHTKHQNYKTLCILLQLLVLPYADSEYIIIILSITLISFRSFYLPSKVRQDLFVTAIFFLSVLIINIYYTTKKKYIYRFIIKVQPLICFNRFVPKQQEFITKIIKSCFYVSLATSRLVLISLTYIFTIKIYLLTTNYEELIISLLKYQRIFHYFYNSHIPFIIILSSQFLKITFHDISKLKMAYLIRNINYKNKFFFSKVMRVYFFLIQSFFTRLHTNIQFISKSLYSRDLMNRNLYITNIHNY